MKKKWIVTCIFATVIGSFFSWQCINGRVLAKENNEEISIDEENFPDEVFRDFVFRQIDENKNAVLESEEIKHAKELKLITTKSKIEDLTGIEYLVNLETLFVSDNALTSLDLSQNVKLKKVNCAVNQIRSLTIAPDALEYLDCGYNCFSELDVSQYKNLTELRCLRAGLKSLDVSHNSKLKRLQVGNIFHDSQEESYEVNKLTKLDISQNETLLSLNCDGNIIADLDISKNTRLQELHCDGNGISSLDIHTNNSLQILSCNNNELIALDLSNNPYLHYLYCENNLITSLDLAKNKNIYEVHCKENQLTDLFLVKHEKLEKLDCRSNQLTQLDLSNAPKLIVLNIENNHFASIDMSANTLLNEFFASFNELTDIIFPQAEKLYTISVRKNQIKSLDLSSYGHLQELDCGQNPIESLDVTNNYVLDIIRCDECELTELNLQNNDNLFEIVCDKNPILTLDLPDTFKIEKLSCSECKLSKIDLKKAARITYLDIHSNDISDIDLSKCTLLQSLYCDHNQLQKLNLENLTELVTLTCEKNQLGALNLLPCTKIVDFLFDSETQLTEKDGVCFYTSPNYPGKFSVDKQVKLLGINEKEKKDFDSFVERLYTVALNRNSDPEGKAFWIKQVVEQGKTGADCARFFLLDAPEFMNRKLTIENFVETLYKTFFDRESDAAGKQGWVSAIRSGKKTRVDVVNDFIESTEWCNVCASYGVKSGALYHKATVPSDNAMEFAARLYTCCLKRAPEEKGLQYWSLALTNLEQTGAHAAQLFFESSEFAGFRTSDTEYVLRLYKTFMGRDPATSEIDYWTRELASNRQTRHGILAFFAQSPEFTSICREYGIERGQID